MPKLRDTSWDPFSSPDDRGLHPNAFRTYSDPSKGTQERYETRLSGDAAERVTRNSDHGGPSPRVAIGSVTQHGAPRFARIGEAPKPPATGGGIGWLLGLGGLAFGAWALMRGGPKSNPGAPSHVEGEPSNTYALHAPTPTVQVTVNVGTPEGTTTSTTFAPSTTSSTIPTAPVLSLPAPVLEAEVVEMKPKRKRRKKRITTQAKDENGKFLPAGTARKHVE